MVAMRVVPPDHGGRGNMKRQDESGPTPLSELVQPVVDGRLPIVVNGHREMRPGQVVADGNGLFAAERVVVGHDAHEVVGEPKFVPQVPWSWNA